MPNRIPPLSALRAFEASARTLSFTRAAEELNLTQAAISYQIRNLEAEIGKPLFHRKHSKLSLTDTGLALRPYVQDAMDTLSAGISRARSDVREGIIRIAASQSLAARWLARRVDRFCALHPEYQLSIEASDALVDLNAGTFDLAIRYAKTVDRSLSATLLITDRVVPVCNPDVISGRKPLRVPSDLANHTLLHDGMDDVSWEHWLSVADVDGVDSNTGITFSHSGLIVDSAIDGHGIALGRPLLVADAIASGRLAIPFDVTVASNYAYFIVHAPDRDGDHKIEAFKAWIAAEAHKSDQLVHTAIRQK